MATPQRARGVAGAKVFKVWLQENYNQPMEEVHWYQLTKYFQEYKLYKSGETNV